MLCFADEALRNSQYFYRTDWSGGKYCSPGMDGSRSGGLLAATWAAMVHLGRSGYRRYAEDIFATSAAMQEAVRASRLAAHHGQRRPSCSRSPRTTTTSTTSTISCARKGWRLNGQQYPNALHMAVTRPQTQPGAVERFARRPRRRRRLRDGPRRTRFPSPVRSTAVSRAGTTDEADAFIKMFMADMMDQQMSIPAP